MKIKLTLEKGEKLPRMSTVMHSIARGIKKEQLEWEVVTIDHSNCEIILKKTKLIPFLKEEQSGTS